MSFRSQFVQIGNQRSNMKAVHQGVPQGSVLGPILFSLYTNELTESIKDQNCRNKYHNPSKSTQNLFGENCNTCGQMNLYADDATLVVTSKCRNENQTQVRRKLETLKTHLNSNKLTLNMEKTTLLETMLKQKRCKNWGVTPHTQCHNRHRRTESNQIWNWMQNAGWKFWTGPVMETTSGNWRKGPPPYCKIQAGCTKAHLQEHPTRRKEATGRRICP